VPLNTLKFFKPRSWGLALNDIDIPLDDAIYSGTYCRKCDFQIIEYLFGLQSYITYSYYFTRRIDSVLTANVDGA